MKKTKTNLTPFLPSLSIFFPCYNDGGTIGSLVIGALKIAEQQFVNYEVIVIDDGSTDHSRSILQELNKQYSNLKLIFHEKNRGYGATLRSGFEACTKDLIFYTDGDAQYDIFELPKLLEKMKSDIDIVNGYKVSRSDPLYRIMIGKFYNFINKKLFRLNIRDIDCDFRLIQTAFLRKMNLHATGGEICVELISKAHRLNASIVEVPVSHYHRVYGKSQFFKIKNIVKTFRGILALKRSLNINSI